LKNSLELIFHELYRKFGPQYWWPAESPFEVIVGAILTQSTNWGNVERAITNLKSKGLLSPKRLYNLPIKKLALAIRSSGYYNIKARRLKEFLRFFLRSYRGDIKKISKEKLDVLRKKLLLIKGIGEETADSILLYALNKPIFVIDAYTLRILCRHGILKKDTSYEDAQSLFMRSLKIEAKMFNEYHALLVRLAKDYCLKSNPRCEICPLRNKKFYF